MKPLTIEQLKALEVGDWVWIKDQMADRGMYVQICMNAQGIYLESKNYGVFPNYSHYGKTWLAWKNKEQAEAKGEIVELPCKVGDTIWVINYEWLRYREQKVACIEIHQYDTFLFLTDKTVFSVAGVGIDLFTNKAAAERRLAELTKE